MRPDQVVLYLPVDGFRLAPHGNTYSTHASKATCAGPSAAFRWAYTYGRGTVRRCEEVSRRGHRGTQGAVGLRLVTLTIEMCASPPCKASTLSASTRSLCWQCGDVDVVVLQAV